MVQTDISQLHAECSDWRQILRNYRDEFHDYEKTLRETCRKSLPREQLPDVDHFQNQFDIQLNNIHHLKQQIKTHERKIEFESSGAENLKEDTYAQHESILNEFLHLESRLQELRNEFKEFISKVSC